MKSRNKILDGRVRKLRFGMVRRKPLFLWKILLKYGRKVIFSQDSLRGVVFASSYSCNFQCSHCYAQRFRDTEERPLSMDEKKVVIKECLEIGATSFDFVGGEIGLSEDLPTLLAACRPDRTHISLASNGYDMSREKVQWLKKLGVDKISVSIDSGSEEEHDQFRRKPGSYRRCFEAIENIREEGLVPVIITCVSKGRTREKSFFDLVNYAINNRVELVFSVAIPFGEWEGNMDVLCDEEDIRYMKELHEQYPFLTRDCYENMGSYGCPAVKQILYVSEYGDIMPCPFAHISFGNVRYEPIRDIRQRMFDIPEFRNYHPCCLAGEDIDFIEKYLSKTFETECYPPHAEKVFGGEGSQSYTLDVFTRDIMKVDRPCPLCSSIKKEVVTSGRDHEFDNTTKDLFFVVKCRECDLVYLNPRPHESTLGIIYPQDYYCHSERFVDSDRGKSLLVSVKKFFNERIGFARRIKNIFAAMGDGIDEPIKILDVGCGNGSALDVFRQVCSKPVETTGLDINAQALELVSKKGHKIIRADICESLLPEEYFDVIYSSNVIEHVADPLGMMKNISGSLKKEGIFLCETPNFNSTDARLFSPSGHWGGFHFPRHWTFFTAETFAKMAEFCDLKLETIMYHPVPIFWIWSMHSYMYHAQGKKRLADWLFPLMENKSNFVKSLGLKIFFTIVDLGLRIVTGRTSLMSIILKKQ